MISILKLASLVIFLTLGGYQFTTETSVKADVTISVENLAKKWKLQKYAVFFYSEQPEAFEKHDFIHLKKNMSFTSISEGNYEVGTWQLDIAKKRFYIRESNGSEALVLIITKLTATKLVVIIDDPTDSDAQYLKIHFTTE